MNDLESLESALLDMYDVEKALSDDALNQPKDSDGTDITVRDCINDVIRFLEGELEYAQVLATTEAARARQNK
tara:strand:+ start:208 stop:426 length:219 start_codon:yes stop_codon:yes gene_type:complete